MDQMKAQPRPSAEAPRRGSPDHPMLIPFPIVCFILTFFLDVFIRAANLEWPRRRHRILGFGLRDVMRRWLARSWYC